MYPPLAEHDAALTGGVTVVVTFAVTNLVLVVVSSNILIVLVFVTVGVGKVTVVFWLAYRVTAGTVMVVEVYATTVYPR